ncbi:unnamed protein product, partial [Ectocarpus sp. 13 AM-2016]
RGEAVAGNVVQDHGGEQEVRLLRLPEEHHRVDGGPAPGRRHQGQLQAGQAGLGRLLGEHDHGDAAGGPRGLAPHFPHGREAVRPLVQGEL